MRLPTFLLDETGSISENYAMIAAATLAIGVGVITTLTSGAEGKTGSMLIQLEAKRLFGDLTEKSLGAMNLGAEFEVALHIRYDDLDTALGTHLMQFVDESGMSFMLRQSTEDSTTLELLTTVANGLVEGPKLSVPDQLVEGEGALFSVRKTATSWQILKNCIVVGTVEADASQNIAWNSISTQTGGSYASGGLSEYGSAYHMVVYDLDA